MRSKARLIQSTDINITSCLLRSTEEKQYTESCERTSGKILRKLCEQKGAEIIGAEVCPDYIRKLVSVPSCLPYSI